MNVASFIGLHWNNDVSKLLFESVQFLEYALDIESDICILDLKSHEAVCPTELFTKFDGQFMRSPVWGNDESIIYFSAIGENGCFLLHAIDLVENTTRVLNDGMCTQIIGH